MKNELYRSEVVKKFNNFVNPYLAKLMNFAGFGVEEHSEGCYIYDDEGKKCLDCLGGYGVFSLGHRHPKVIEAVKKQLDKIPLTSKVFFNKPMADLAEKLAEITPGKLQYTFFCNSGAEAVEGALKFAKGATGKSKIISTYNSYHGKTLGALSVTGREVFQEKFRPLLPGPIFVKYGDPDAIAQVIDNKTACVIIEPIQGEGGINVPPPGYLKAIREACDKHGALMIIDEVQTGLGRTGMTFGCNHDKVAPDIMTLAKALGGGVMPIGAIVGTPEVWEQIYGKNPTIHSSTFGGSPLACAAGLAALQVLEEEGLVENAKHIGNILKSGLEDVQRDFPDLIVEVRGKGLLIGVEFSMDDVGELVIAQMVKRGLIAAYTLNNRRVIRFEPPLIMKISEADLAVEIFRESVKATAEMLAEVSSPANP